MIKNNFKTKRFTLNALRSSRGFTLIELLLYVAIVGVIVTSVSVMFTAMSDARVKQEVIQEVEANGSFAMRVILQSIRNGSAVSLPLPGNNGGTLSMTTGVPAKDPTVFDVVSGRLRMTEGASSPIFITSPSVSVSGLVFRNLSYSSSPDTIGVYFSVSYLSNSMAQIYNYSQKFYGTANQRQ